MRKIQLTMVLCTVFFSAGILLAQEEKKFPANVAKPQAEQAEQAKKAEPQEKEAKPRPEADTTVLDTQQWKEVDESVEKALKWLISQQQADGSFPSKKTGQPGVTGLCMLAFMSQGHLPDEGEYGDQLQRALDFIVSCQKRSGLIALEAPDVDKLSRRVAHDVGYTCVYNHAIAALVLTESYAMTGSDQTKPIKPIIEKALMATYQMQDFRRARKDDEGGWRYLDIAEFVDADLSVTAWQLMFMRSAKNAGFDIEEERITRAIKFVHRCFQEDRGTFSYKVGFPDRPSRGMAGAGILALAHSGLHDSPEAQRAGDWILKSGFHEYNEMGRVKDIVSSGDRYHYGLLTSSQAMYQLGGRHWRDFFPPTVRVLMDNQSKDGSWKTEKMHNDRQYGNAYTTAIGVLTLSTPNDLLPIFQR